MSLLQLGKRADAALQFEKAAALVPEKADIQYQLGLTYYELKNYVQAEGPLRSAIEIDPGYGLAYYTLGLVYSKIGRPDEAGQMLDKAKELGVE
jgi:Tfp pilus assembly protein PilF